MIAMLMSTVHLVSEGVMQMAKGQKQSIILPNYKAYARQQWSAW